ncbi:MAG TPA: DCC1-like thiol-disulfide oxidoreductase family protein [Terriglobales bacterium]
MISLTSEFTDGKSRHARGWLFYDAECDFCTHIARWIRKPMLRRGLAVAPLQDSRVAALLGMPGDELLRAIRYLGKDGLPYAGADALVELAREFWWARPLVWASRVHSLKAAMRSGYECMARQRNCHAETHCRHEVAHMTWR